MKIPTPPKTETLLSERSPFQTIEIIATATHGKMLVTDDQIMFSERDEHIHHEMMAHVPLFLHPEPKKILIIGGGDGGTAREILKHTSVESITLVEIDEALVKACKGYFTKTAVGLLNPRVKVILEDGIAWVAKTAELEKEKFDVICIEPSDPVSFALSFIGQDFYAGIKKLLNFDGILVGQAESPFFADKMQSALAETLKHHFNRVHFFNYTDLSTPGGLYSLSYASPSIHPIDDLNSARVISSAIECDWYNLGVHEAAFLLPQFQKEALSSFLNPL